MRPIIALGVDIGYKRDTSAVSGVYRDGIDGRYKLYCHRCWEPPVSIPEVTAYVRFLLEEEAISGVWFDPSQWASEAQRLSEEGFGHLLREVNQSGSFMIAIATHLHALAQRGDFRMYADGSLRNQFSWCAVKAMEAGPRIVKSAQSKPIDLVVATSMALWGAAQEVDYVVHQAYREEKHTLSLRELP